MTLEALVAVVALLVIATPSTSSTHRVDGPEPPLENLERMARNSASSSMMRRRSLSARPRSLAASAVLSPSCLSKACSAALFDPSSLAISPERRSTSCSLPRSSDSAPPSPLLCFSSASANCAFRTATAPSRSARRRCSSCIALRCSVSSRRRAAASPAALFASSEARAAARRSRAAVSSRRCFVSNSVMMRCSRAASRFVDAASRSSACASAVKVPSLPASIAACARLSATAALSVRRAISASAPLKPLAAI